MFGSFYFRKGDNVLYFSSRSSWFDINTLCKIINENYCFWFNYEIWCNVVKKFRIIAFLSMILER